MSDLKISATVVGSGCVMAVAAVAAGILGQPSREDGHPGPALFAQILAVNAALVVGPVLSAFSLRGTEALCVPGS